jgi:hypothetical protein
MQELGNPEVAQHLHLYPEMQDGPISQFWEAERLRDCDRSHLCPMYAQGFRHFYVNELAELDTGELVIPLMWITLSDVMHADCLSVTRLDSVRFVCVSHRFC